MNQSPRAVQPQGRYKSHGLDASAHVVREAFSFLFGEPGQHELLRIYSSGRSPYAHANPDEISRLGRLGYGSNTPVPAVPSPTLDANLPWCEVEVVVYNNHGRRVHVAFAQYGRNGQAAQVHVRLGLDQRGEDTVDADLAYHSIFTDLSPQSPLFLGEQVRYHEPEVMTMGGVRFPGIAEPHHHDAGSQRRGLHLSFSPDFC